MRKKCVIFYLEVEYQAIFFILKRDFYQVGSTEQENNPSGKEEESHFGQLTSVPAICQGRCHRACQSRIDNHT